MPKQESTLEKRLQIDVFSSHESHEKGDLRYLGWIPGTENVADGLAEGIVTNAHPLWKLMSPTSFKSSHKDGQMELEHRTIFEIKDNFKYKKKLLSIEYLARVELIQDEFRGTLTGTESPP